MGAIWMYVRSDWRRQVAAPVAAVIVALALASVPAARMARLRLAEILRTE